MVVFPIIICTFVCDHINFLEQLNKFKKREYFLYFRGLLMPECRSPPFFA